MTAEQAQQHKWLCNPAAEAALELQKKRLKRYVIKKRWAKAVNMIVALRRMGAKLDL